MNACAMRIEGVDEDLDLVWSSNDGPAWFNRLCQLDEQVGGAHKWQLVYERDRYKDDYWVEQAGDYFKVMVNDGAEKSITLYETSLL
jgi:hypothetical protein